MLASQSGWFYDYFKEHCEPFLSNESINIQKIRIHVQSEEENIFSLLLDLLYSGHIQVSSEQLPIFLKITNTFKFTVLHQYFAMLINDVLASKESSSKDSSSNKSDNSPPPGEIDALKMIGQFIKLGLEEDTKIIVPRLASGFHSLITNPYNAKTKLTKRGIFDSLSPLVFVNLLTCPEFQEKLKSNKSNHIDFISLIDEFISYKTSSSRNFTLSVAEREGLSHCAVDWEAPDAFLLLTDHKCTWLPSRIRRRLLATLIRQRGKAATAFRRDAESAENVSHWFPFAWLTQVHRGRVTSAPESFDAVELIATLGGVAKRFNPHVFGFVKTCEPVIPADAMELRRRYDMAFSPRFPLENQWGMTDDGTRVFHSFPGYLENPAVGYDFGPKTRFRIERVSLDMDSMRINYGGVSLITQMPGQVEVKKFAGDEELPKLAQEKAVVKKIKENEKMHKKRIGSDKYLKKRKDSIINKYLMHKLH